MTIVTDPTTGSSPPDGGQGRPGAGPTGFLRPMTWSALAGLVAAAFAAPMLAAPLSIFDGGIAASAGTFILHGGMPYRDFWLLYGPLTAYLAAALTALFGTDLIVLRTAGLILVGVTALLGHSLIAIALRECRAPCWPLWPRPSASGGPGSTCGRGKSR